MNSELENTCKETIVTNLPQRLPAGTKEEYENSVREDELSIYSIEVRSITDSANEALGPVTCPEPSAL